MAARTSPSEGDAILSVPGTAAITRLSAVDTVRARILLSIEHELLSPGSKLPSTESIAAGLEVSPITARRGLESLVADGVLVRRPGRGGGTFVTEAPPQLDDPGVLAYRADGRTIHRLVEQRSLMESAIVHAAALRATPEECDQLDELIAQSQASRDWMEHHVPDAKFHRLVADMSGLPEKNAYLAVYEELIRYFVPYPQPRLEVSRDEHRALVAAFRRHDPVAAVAVIRDHVSALHREMFVGLEA